ncbi:DUF5067 domain-containing protein [Corynebacterium pseudodiphtheriticum]|uniref:DUF5067 domain-containing protein n=1 Tax=Corynebacterium pseudodiphtheriticum TaxID=37637 RepID=UPI0025514533|nr:DUF5067 domain-containing protein [Corynebacterium pseudodiphtheriticum]MDK8545223.1 DUF5067 domain-containing protein [Corynebacterium pseudodiphtheriticum]
MKSTFRMPLIIAISSVTFLLASCGNDASDTDALSQADSATSTETVDTAQASNSNESFSDGVLETESLKIEITDVRKIAVGEPGNEYGEKPVLGFWYNTTNTTDEPMAPNGWIMHFTAIQDNDPNKVNELNVAGHPDMSLIDNSFEDIKPGGTVPDAIAYELDDESTPVKLQASSNWGKNQLGTQTFQIP